MIVLKRAVTFKKIIHYETLIRTCYNYYSFAHLHIQEDPGGSFCGKKSVDCEQRLGELSFVTETVSFQVNLCTENRARVTRSVQLT